MRVLIGGRWQGPKGAYVSVKLSEHLLYNAKESKTDILNGSFHINIAEY